MKESSRFFGLHFDYHACKETRGIGSHFDEKVLRRIIEEVHPDFIQCDTKGHPGLTSYPTKIGTPAPGLEADLLGDWRKVTKEYGIPLYSHYSGVWDKKAAEDHPDWAAASKEGEPSDRMSAFGPYEDSLMLPELQELVQDYGMNGAWVDGDCWACITDYSENAKKAFQEQTGKKPEEVSEHEYLDFCRKGFFHYVERYVSAVHSWNPEFKITSNWMNTAWVPDALDLTDYISGDLSPTNSVDSARFDGRIMAMAERPWDIMSWGIHFPVHHTKGVAQLEQEAACVLSLGGGFQIYNMQDPTNVCLEPDAIPNWAEVSRFCHDRKAFCYGGSFVPDLGLLYSIDSYYDCIHVPFNRDCPYNFELYGTMLGLLDQGASLNVLSEQKLDEETLRAYPRFAVSNSTKLNPKTIQALLSYANQGGELLLMGADTLRLFAGPIGYKITEKEDTSPVFFLQTPKGSLEIRDEYLCLDALSEKPLALLTEAVVTGDLACTNPPPTILKGNQTYAALVSLPFGKGKIILVPFNLGKSYLQERTFQLESFFQEVTQAFSFHRVEHNHPGELEAVVREKEGKTYLHLINLLGPHRVPSVATFDAIPPLHDVMVSLFYEQAPHRLFLEPEHIEIPFEYDEANKRIHLHLDILSLYDIIAVE